MILLWILSPLPSLGFARPVRMPLSAAKGLVLPAGWAFLLALSLTTLVWGQGGRMVDPKPFGIDLPAGLLQPSQGQRVTTMDGEGMLVVGRLYAQVGDAAVVLLPDGQLATRKREEYSVTDRKFEPLAKDVLAKRLVAGEFKDFKVRHTRHYVYVYKSSDEFWIGTRGILESMLGGVIKQMRGCGLTVRDPELPLVVVLFANKAEFQKYRRMPDDVTAYYHPLSNRVFLHEPKELGELSRELAVSQAISTVAHEGAHQILHNIGVQQRLSAWPMWLSEGLAEYFAPTTFGKNLTWIGPGRNDLRMFELQRYLNRSTEAAPDGRMIEQTVSAPRLTSAGYAAAWALTHFLIRSEKASFNKYLKEISSLGPFEGNCPDGEVFDLKNLEQFKTHFGKDMAALETRLIDDLKRLPYQDPFAELPHFLVQIVVTIGKRPHYRAEIFYSSKLGEDWAKKLIAALPAEQQSAASQNIIRFRNRQEADEFKKVWLNKGPLLPAPAVAPAN